MVMESKDNDQEPVVQAHQVAFSYGRLRVLDGVSLQIPRGQVFGILGANGAGKTTLIRILVGLLKPQAGTVQVLGEAPSTRLFQRLGYMPQLNALYLELAVQQNVDFFARMYDLANSAQRREAVEAALNFVGLWERRKDSIL